MNPTFWNFTIGNVLTIVGGMVTLAALWWRTAQKEQRQDDRVDTLADRLNKSEEELSQMTRVGLLTTISQHERRLATCEEALGDISEMKTDIRWIKEKLNHGDR